MDENLKDVLLVLFGGLLSLLGSGLAIFFEQRRDRQLARRERQISQTEEIIEYLYSISRLYSVIVDYFNTQVSGINYDVERFQSNINPLLERLHESRLHGLPPQLMSRDQVIVDKIAKLNPHIMELNVIVKLINSGKYQTKDEKLAKSQIEKFSSMNSEISGILEELEKRIK